MNTAALPRVEQMRWWDIERAAELERLLFATDSPWTAAMFWSELAVGHHYVVCRDPAAAVIGYAGLARHVDLAEVQTIGVHPDWQGRGIGRALLVELIESAGDQRVLLDVRTDNRAAIALYRAHGFVRIGLRRRYYQPSGADAYTMARPPGSKVAAGRPADGPRSPAAPGREVGRPVREVPAP